MKTDTEIFSLIQKEKKRQIEGLELIASENFVSTDVMAAMGTVLTNKYAEGLPSKRYYGGCEVVDEIESLCIERVKKLFGVEWANVQPHSGSQANAAIMLACLNPGDKILGFNLSNGGHLTHGSPVNFSGKLYNSVFYGVEKDTGIVDYNVIKNIAKKEKPKLIICGASSYSRDWDYKAFREIADTVGAILMADISHPAGLIAKNLLQNPVDHCHVISSTTHKTLRGPRGGILMMGKDFENPWGLKTPRGNTKKMSQIFDSAVFPGTQGGPLEHVIASKAVAFGEALNDNFKNYGKQVIKNAQQMAKEFIKLDYTLVSNGTDNHCMLIDLRNKNITGKEAEDTLVKANITLNKNMVPFDDKSPFVTSGIRIGTPAITTRGLKENEMTTIVDFIDKIITNNNNPKIIKEIKHKVIDFMKGRPLFQ